MKVLSFKRNKRSACSERADKCEVKALDDRTSKVEVNADMNPLESSVFYRHLIRMMRQPDFDKNKISFYITGSNLRAAALAENLKSKGFDEVYVDGMLFADSAQIKEFLFDSFEVAGLYYHIENSDDVWLDVFIGKELKLLAEPANEFDANAVAIYLPLTNGSDRKIGYIPRTHNPYFATILAAGWSDILRIRISDIIERGKAFPTLMARVYVKDKGTLNFAGS